MTGKKPPKPVVYVTTTSFAEAKKWAGFKHLQCVRWPGGTGSTFWKFKDITED